MENLYSTLINLESDRLLYYANVVRVGKNLFIALDFKELVDELDKMIYFTIEKPLQAPFSAIVEAYYNPRFVQSKRAFTRIGSVIDYREVSRMEIGQRLEYIKDFIYDKATQMSSLIRFTKHYELST